MNNSPDTREIVNKYLNGDRKEYMLTIARDGEDPVRSIYFFRSSLDAVEAYNRYTNFGFAKNYLTVTLYQPNGEFHQKKLYRPPAGECSYVRQNYIDVISLLLDIKNSVEIGTYNLIVNRLALIFSQDNIRFDSARFIVEAESIEIPE